MKNDPFPRGMLVIFIAVMLLLLSGGAWFYISQQQRLELEIKDNLQAVAQYKMERIMNWRAERLGDAGMLTANPYIVKLADRFIKDKGSTEGSELREFFLNLKRTYGYSDVLLLDPDGRVYLRLAEGQVSHHGVDAALEEALRERKPVIADLHIETGDSVPHLSIVAPLCGFDGGAYSPFGAIVLICNARQFLFPLIQAWPTRSRSAETLLVRKEGDSVLFLNELRHRSGTALTFRLPLDSTEVPAVMAAFGKEGLVEGADYRGVKVLAVLRSVPGSPWKMVAKIDKTEAFAEWKSRAVLIVSLILGCMAALTAATLSFWQRFAKKHYRDMYQAEQSRQESEERYRITLMCVGDGVIATDAKGRVTLLNPVAEALTGWTQAEAIGRPLEDVFRIINEDTRQTVENPVRRVLIEGVIVGLANHTALISKDGAERPVADSGAPIRNESGEITGVVLVFRDQTEERRTRKRIHESESRYRSLFEAMSEGVCLHEIVYGEEGAPSDYRILDVNPVFENIVGMNRTEVIGNLASKTYKLSPPPYLDLYAGVALTGEPVSFETFFQPMQKYFHIMVYSPGKGLFATVFQDITERKAAEKELKTKEVLLDEMGRLGKIGGWEFDVETLEGTWTDEVARIHDFDPHDRTSATVGLSVFQGDMRRKIEEAIHNAIQHGEPYDLELEMITAKGNRKWVRTIGQPVREGGRVVKLRGSFQDITVRRQAEEELRKSEEKISSILKDMPDALYSVDMKDSSLLQTNPSMSRIFGRPIEDFYSDPKLYMDMVHPDDRNIVQQYSEELDRAGDSECIYRIVRPDGDLRWVAQRSKVVLDKDGVPVRVDTLFSDITGRKKEEEARAKLEEQLVHAQKMESVGRLAGGVAHDFNNMLQTVLGFTDMALQDVPKESSLHECLQEIFKAAQRSNELTRQLLAFARRQTVAPKVLDLNETVTGILKLLRRLIGEDIDLLWAPGRDIWKIKIDPSQVDQLLANLVVNARDAINGVGKITIETENASVDEAYCDDHTGFLPGDFVKMTVSDNGCGMTRETLMHVFEPFFTTKEMGYGTGLGLATVYGVVKQNKGFINVYSEPGQGTTFKIYLPRSESGVETAQYQTEQKALQRGEETVLLVEDEDTILQLNSKILNRLGYKAIAVGSPLEAIRVAQEYESDIHLLMTDVVMPEMNGRDLARRILEIKPGIKCLYTSGYTANVIAHHGVLDEGVNFIQKPFAVNDLSQKIRETLDFGKKL